VGAVAERLAGCATGIAMILYGTWRWRYMISGNRTEKKRAPVPGDTGFEMWSAGGAILLGGLIAIRFVIGF
jgi:hypothetical protein